MENLTRRQMLRSVVALTLLPLFGCSQRRERAGFLRRTFFRFDTVCEIGGAMDEDVLDQVQFLCMRFEQLFSRTIPASDVGRINVAGGKPVEVDPQTAELILCALGYSEASNGLFDITIGAVSELWDFTEGVVPAKDAIARALPHVGWRTVHVDGDVVWLDDPDARIDLGGIAKGYMTDKILELLVRNGVKDAFVNLGGNVAVLGHNEAGEPWSIGVRDPFGEAKTGVIARIQATQGSLVTSGLYERSFEKDGTRYWHILDPRTGWPVKTDLVSASLYCLASIDGDGYTKPLFMMDGDDAMAFAEHVGAQALLMSADGSSAMTPEAEFELTATP